MFFLANFSLELALLRIYKPVNYSHTIHAMTAQQIPPEYITVLSVFAFGFGACVGSFLNVCVWRMPIGESVIFPSSHCPMCHYRIKTYENIPIISWILLRGKCSYCRSPISPRYILMEFVTGSLFLALWLQCYVYRWPIALLIPLCYLGATALIVAVVDFKHLLIPNQVTYTGLILAFIVALVFPSTHRYFGIVPDPIRFAGGGSLTILILDHFGRWYPEIYEMARLYAVFDALLGCLIGGGTLLFVKEIGKLMWGERAFRPATPANVSIDRHGMEIDNSRKASWSELLLRKRDAVTIYGHIRDISIDPALVSDFDRHEAAAAEKVIRVSREKIEIDGRSIPRRHVIKILASTSHWIEPREAMGMGDVKYMAMLGAFLGTGPVVTIIGVSSLIGFVAGVITALVKVSFLHKHPTSVRVPYGTYISLTVIVFLTAPSRTLLGLL